jgi:hypothetical protein
LNFIQFEFRKIKGTLSSLNYFDPSHQIFFLFFGPFCDGWIIGSTFYSLCQLEKKCYCCRGGAILGLAMACSNTFGLVTGAFLLGFGLSEIPKDIWKNANWNRRQKVLSHIVAKMDVKLVNAHEEYCNTIAVCASLGS